MIFLALNSFVAATVKIRKESGTAFIETSDKTYFYMDDQTVRLNILRPTPRSLLNAEDYHQCNKQLDNFCDFLFNTFDNQVLEFLNLDLVKRIRHALMPTKPGECPKLAPNPYSNGQWCCSNQKEKSPPFEKSWAKKWNITENDPLCDGSNLSFTSKCCQGIAKRCSQPPCRLTSVQNKRQKRDALNPYATITLDDHKDPANSTSSTDTSTRLRRGVPVIVQFGIVVVFALSAFFIGESIVESDVNNFQSQILEQEAAIRSLSKAVKLDHTTLQSVVNYIRADSEIVLAPNVTLSAFHKYMKSKTVHKDFDPTKNVRKFQRYYTNHISELSKDEANAFEANVLQLQNNRLPLNKEFLIAVRARCIALQPPTMLEAQSFCNDLAFYATRWNSGLLFNGIGFQLDNDKRLQSIIYSLTIKIPILQTKGLREFDIVNLGRFQSANIIRKIDLPQKAVIKASGKIHPLDDTKCLQLNKYKACPEEAIKSFSSCLQSVFSHEISVTCKTNDEVTPKTCVGRFHGPTMIISMFGNGTAHYDRYQGNLIKRPEEVNSFAAFSRSSIRGTLFCKQSEHKHVAPDLEIPALQAENLIEVKISEIESFNSDLEFVPPVSASMEKMQKDLLQAGQAMEESQKTLFNIRHNTSTILGNLKNHFEDTVSTVETKLNGVYRTMITNVILPLVLPPLCIAAFVFLLWNRIKSCCKNTSASNSTKKSRSFVFSEHDSRKEEIDLSNQQEVELVPQSS